MFASRPIVSRLLTQSVRRYHAGDGHFKPATMDELPVPKGSWQEQYNANNRRYNATLAFGIAFTAFSLVVAKTSGLIYLNFSPPKSLD